MAGNPIIMLYTTGNSWLSWGHADQFRNIHTSTLRQMAYITHQCLCMTFTHCCTFLVFHTNACPLSCGWTGIHLSMPGYISKDVLHMWGKRAPQEGKGTFFIIQNLTISTFQFHNYLLIFSQFCAPFTTLTLVAKNSYVWWCKTYFMCGYKPICDVIPLPS